MRRKNLRSLLYILICVLVFEGITRKVLPGFASQLFIFVKDFVSLLIAVSVLNRPLPKSVELLRSLWFGLVVAMVPLCVLTALHDPVLAIFGMKQYLLFFPVAFAIPIAFQVNGKNPTEILNLGRFFAFLIVPTSALALVQIALPDSHWLNLSVAGEDLSGFSAGGYLRISSTFPFISQYNFFLTFVSGWVALGIRFRGKKWLSWVIRPWIVLPAYMIGLFATGSRQSVVGASIIVVVASISLIISGRAMVFRRFLLLGIGAVVALLAAQLIFPSAFGAYEARTGGETFSAEHSTEMAGRLNQALFGWTYFAERSDAGLFGNGIGVMSNGSQQLSAYAAMLRGKFGWGEVDLANTVFEGGYYLAFIWMLFRFGIIFICLGYILKIRSNAFLIPASLLFGFVVFNGIVGTLGIQPPLYLWWSFAVGSIILLLETENQLRINRKNSKKVAEVSGDEKAV